MKTLLLLLIPCMALAQFETLALSADGSQLLFTSRLLLRQDTTSSEANRFYRYAPENPEILRLAPVNFSFTGAYLSSDGRAQGQFCTRNQVTGTRNGFLFYSYEGLCLQREGSDLGQFGEQATGFSVRISRNGRFVWEAINQDIYVSSGLREIGPNLFTLFPRLAPLHNHNAVSDGGVVLASYPNYGTTNNRAVALLRRGEQPAVLYDGTAENNLVSSAAISPDGRFAFIQTQSPENLYSLLEINLATKQQRKLLESEDQPIQFAVSQDASSLLIRFYQSLSILDRASNSLRPLADTPDFIASAVLSDDGSTVAYLRANGSITKIDTATAKQTQLYGPTPNQLRGKSGAVFPGSAILFTASGFEPDTRLELNGIPIQPFRREVQNIAEQDLQIQVPWETPLDPNSTYYLEATQPGSPFRLRTRLSGIDKPYPGLFTYRDEANQVVLSAASQDFSALHSSTYPAPAGTTIHAYLWGVGPTDQPLSNNQPGPLNPPAKPLAQPTCYLLTAQPKEEKIELKMPFLAYAPGLIGVYQADLTIPADTRPGRHDLICTLNQQNFSNAPLFTSRD